MKLIQAALAAAFGIASISAFAQNNPEASIKKTLEPRLGTKIDSVTKTPYAGLFEVRIGSDIVYTDAGAKYLFDGRVLDVQTGQDYTKERIDDISKIKFSELPFDSALKMVKGNGKRVIAVFEDPNCGYCKRFRQTLHGMDNITVYTFMYNILSEDSVNKSKNIWCAADRNKAWDDWMLHNKVPAATPESCTAPHEKIFELGRKLRITGTPTVFFTDGTRIPGAIDAKGLEKKFATIK